MMRAVLQEYRTMHRTLLPLSLLAASLVAQDPPVPIPVPVPVPVPPVVVPGGIGGVIVEDFGEAPSPEVLAKTEWLAPGPVAEPKWTLFVCTNAVMLEGQRGCLEDLQKRFGERGARIAVVLPREDAKALAAKKAPFAVGALDEAPLTGTCWFAAGAQAPFFAAVDGAADLLAAAADGKDLAPLQLALQQIESLLANTADGGDFRTAAAQVVALLPHSGRARATAVLVEWWCTGDLDAARAQFDAGMKALATEPWALAVFADLVLRGDHNDPSYARELAMELTPVAAAAPDNPFVQLVQLRALLRAGQDKLAGRMLSAVGKLCAGDARNQVLYAETLMEANEPAPYRAIAERALDAAAAAGSDPRWFAAARHKVLVRSGAPAEECDKLMADFRSVTGIDGGQLNNDAWYMMVRPETMGRFDSYALAQCEEMKRQEGDNMSYGNKDTLALSLFLNGKVQEAVELETVAMAASSNDPQYVGRLTRFKNTLAQKTAKPRESGAKESAPKESGQK
jgi:hypothetical protein